MEFNVKVSVIMPVYNAEKYLGETLDSVLNQSLKAIELICIDDGSTDSSVNILKYAREQDSRVKIYYQKHQGSGGARNIGINNAKGEFIAFIDSDDFYPSKDTLEKLYNKAIENNAELCGGALVNFKNGKFIGSINNNESLAFDKEGFLNYAKYQLPYGYTRFIYNRELIINRKLIFPSYLRGQDPPFFVNAMLSAQSVYVIRDDTYVYRLRNATYKWTYDAIYDFLYCLRDLLVLSKENKLEKLHFLVVKRLINLYFQVFYSLFTNLNLQSRYYSVINYVDKKILNNLFLDVDTKNCVLNSQKDDSMQKFSNFYIEKGIQHIYLYCANDIGMYFFRKLRQKNKEVEAIFDQNAKNKKLETNIKVQEFDLDLIREHSVIVISSKTYFEEIKSKLNSLINIPNVYFYKYEGDF